MNYFLIKTLMKHFVTNVEKSKRDWWWLLQKICVIFYLIFHLQACHEEVN